MTDLESPKKNNDCYFYYYSTCSKGANCPFRHEPSALGCETVCQFWKEGKCLNVHCNFRHMELRKNRKAIQCYWETQPNGCLKPHCPFMHNAPRGVPSADIPVQSEKIYSDKCNETDTFKPTPSVDSLVVNFGEESDNESTSSFPEKLNTSMCEKTQEEIRLEKIQEACAAYYSYPLETAPTPSQEDLRQRIWNRLRPTLAYNHMETVLDQELEQITFKRKEQFMEENRFKRTKVAKNITLDDIKVKTLAEIRAEKAKKQVVTENNDQIKETVHKSKPLSIEDVYKDQQKELESRENEVSSTCPDDELPEKVENPSMPKAILKPVRKLNLKKIIANTTDDTTVSSNQKNFEDNKHSTSQQHQNHTEQSKEEIFTRIDDTTVSSNQTNIEDNHNSATSQQQHINAEQSKEQIEEKIDNREKHVAESKTDTKSKINKSNRDSLDEILLLEENDGDVNMTSTTEDDLLNDIDDLLND